MSGVKPVLGCAIQELLEEVVARPKYQTQEAETHL